MSRTFAFLLLAIGSLSAVSARPFIGGYKQDADEQGLRYLPYYPSQQDVNAKEEGYTFSYPQSQSTAEKEGSISFDWAKQQLYISPFADQQGIRFTYPEMNRATAKQQIISNPYYYLNNPFARKAGFSINIPQQQGVPYKQAQKQGRRVGWGQIQDNGNEQSYSFQWPQQQSFGYTQGRRIGWPQVQSNGNEQGYRFNWPQQQGFTVNIPQETAQREGFTRYYPQAQEHDAEKQGFGVTIGWQGQSQTGEEQGIGLSYRWPQTEKETAKKEGITFSYPQKQTSSTAEKEGITVSFPQDERESAEAQRRNFGVSYNWPQLLEKATQEDLSEIIEKLLAEKE